MEWKCEGWKEQPMEMPRVAIVWWVVQLSEMCVSVLHYPVFSIDPFSGDFLWKAVSVDYQRLK